MQPMLPQVWHGRAIMLLSLHVAKLYQLVVSAESHLRVNRRHSLYFS